MDRVAGHLDGRRADQLEQLLAPIFDVADVKRAKAIASGLPAGPGAASGKIYLNADRAVIAEAKGEKVLLVRNETSPEDVATQTVSLLSQKIFSDS